MLEPDPVRFRVLGDTVLLTDAVGRRWTVSPGEAAAVPPGDYDAVSGPWEARLRAGPEGLLVLEGAAAWDGEALHMGAWGTLVLRCAADPARDRLLTVTASDGDRTLPVGYDPGTGGVVTPRLLLPAGPVRVACGDREQSLTLHPGQTLRLEP